MASRLGTSLNRSLGPALGRRAAMTGAVAAGLAPRAASAARRVLRIGESTGVGSPMGNGCNVLAQAVAADPLLSPFLRVDVYHSAELGDDLVTVAGCANGTIDMAICSVSVFSNFAPAVGLLDTPFLFKSAAIARAALDGDAGAELALLLKAQGINVLAWAENGLRHMTANRPIRRPADLVGLKMRVPQSEVEVSSFQALGADPHPLPFMALYEALRSGEFEAQENPIAVIEAAHLYEVQKVLSMTTHIYSAATVIASQDLLDDLTPPQRLALTTCAHQAGAVTRMQAEAAQRDGVARMRAAGMTVIEEKDIDTAAFIAASKPNMAVLGRKYGVDLMDRLIHAGAGA
jgi:tripartite ATP-independent transporter DctP family solute receptor